MIYSYLSIMKIMKINMTKIIAIANHTERDELLVIYEHVDNHTVWARPYNMFNSLVDKLSNT